MTTARWGSMQGRLPCYKSTPDVAYWENHWKDLDIQTRLAPFRDGHLGKFEGVFECFLPRCKRVLEAGCGQGQYVMSLHNRGFDVFGVDSASTTVENVRRVFPDLELETGDVKRLNLADGSLSGYISLGVIEHDENGPQDFLAEATRVLDDDGVAIFTVPYLNPARRIKFLRGRKGDPRSASFYQYNYSRQALEPHLSDAGLEIVHFEPYNAVKTLSDDFHVRKAFLERKSIRDYVKGSALLNRLFARNAIYVCRKKGFRAGRQDLPDVVHALALTNRDIVVRRPEEMDAALQEMASDRFARLVLAERSSACLQRLLKAKQQNARLLAHRTVIVVSAERAPSFDRRVAQVTLSLSKGREMAYALMMFGTSQQRSDILIDDAI